MQMKPGPIVTAVLCFALLIEFSPTITYAQSFPTPGDGTFKPRITQVAPIDKRGYPITAEVSQPEPQFSSLMVPGMPTGDTFTIKFPTGDFGGPCINTGKARYLVDSTGTLIFEILADCGNLRRGYDYPICRLAETLHCAEAPSWYFTGRTYTIKTDGLLVNGTALHAWKDPAEAPQLLQAMTTRIKTSKERFGIQGATRAKRISCRSFDSVKRLTTLHVIETTCLVKSVCSGMPNLEDMGEGDLIDMNSTAGSFVKRQTNDPGVSKWICWVEIH
jgi:hypothetical protein